MYKHYIRTNEAGTVVHGFSDAFEQPQDGDIQIYEGDQRHFHLAHPWPLQNERGQYRFRWVNGQRVAKAQDELDAEWAARPPGPPTHEQRMRATEDMLLEFLLGGTIP